MLKLKKTYNQLRKLTDQAGYTANYGDYKFYYDDGHNQWLHMVSSTEIPRIRDNIKKLN